MVERSTDLLIVGAGPYGLALAAYAGHLGIDHAIAGKPMDFWRAHMPDGMYLRSASDWHLDPVKIATIEAWAAGRGWITSDIEPLSRAAYLEYTDWFQREKGIETVNDPVLRLDHLPDGTFRAELASGDAIAARRVVLALGFGAFRHIPEDLALLLPPGRFGHTCDEVDCSAYAGKRCVILGGRQSAYEWAALLREAGAAEVHIVHRKAPPAFAEADWSWVGPMVDAAAGDPGWYRRLSPRAKDEIGQRLYAEGRLKVEPWLESRVLRDGIHRWPNAHLVACMENAAGELVATLDTGQQLIVDRVILATGYKVQIDQIPLLQAGNILPELRTHNGFPVLDEHFGTSVPGLFITSMPATQDFGPFFAFTIAVRMSARVIGDRLARDPGLARGVGSLRQASSDRAGLAPP